MSKVIKKKTPTANKKKINRVLQKGSSLRGGANSVFYITVGEGDNPPSYKITITKEGDNIKSVTSVSEDVPPDEKPYTINQAFYDEIQTVYTNLPEPEKKFKIGEKGYKIDGAKIIEAASTGAAEFGKKITLEGDDNKVITVN